MPKQKDLKRRVRERMSKTGESYTAARAQLGRKQRSSNQGASRKPRLPKDLAAIAGMSDAAVSEKTGKDWRSWAEVLDAIEATTMPHREIASYLQEEHDVPRWWAQMVTVAYERFRGLREKNQRRGGGYDVNKSKTYPGEIEHLFRAFGELIKSRPIAGTRLTLKKSTPNKSLRLRAGEHPVNVYFWAKGRAKSQVQIQHRNLVSQADVARLRTEWSEFLEELGVSFSRPAD